MSVLIVFAAGLASLVGCPNAENQGVYRSGLVSSSGEPAYITVKHCLISFRGRMPEVSRDEQEARELAAEILDRAKQGEDFDELIKEYSDAPRYKMLRVANNGYDDDMESLSKRVLPRRELDEFFTGVAFALEVGEIGLAEFEPEKCPFGWHIIKRTD